MLPAIMTALVEAMDHCLELVWPKKDGKFTTEQVKRRVGEMTPV